MSAQRALARAFVVIVAVVLAGFATGRAEAQRKEGFISYGWSQPLGDLQDYTDNDSWVGLALEGNRTLGERTAIGILLGLNTFYSRTDELVAVRGASLHGDQYRNINSYPIMGQFLYHMGERYDGGLYLGLATGVYYQHQIMDIGISSFVTDNWIFGVAPSIGYRFRLSHASIGQFNIRYHCPLDAGDYIGDTSASMQHLTVSIGVGQGTY